MLLRSCFLCDELLDGFGLLVARIGDNCDDVATGDSIGAAADADEEFVAANVAVVSAPVLFEVNRVDDVAFDGTIAAPVAVEVEVGAVTLEVVAPRFNCVAGLGIFDSGTLLGTAVGVRAGT
jgi:hypothetical protein